MSDPSYSMNNYTSDTTPATPVKKHPDNDPTFLSYFDEKNIEKNIKTDTYELVLSFVASTAISVYNKDPLLVAMERAGLLVIGQFSGGLVANGLLYSDYFSKGQYAKYKSYVPTILKIVGASTVFVAGNVEVLGSQQAPSELAIEGAVASTIGHYGSQWMRKSNNKKKAKKVASYDTVQTYSAY